MHCQRRPQALRWAVMRRSHLAAVVAIPDGAVGEKIQEVRKRYDRKIDRWMPHVTLLFPFRPVEEFEEAAGEVQAAVAGIPPFEVTLARLKHFDHGEGKFTLWLDPEPADPFTRLQAALQKAFPDLDDTSRFRGGFKPHLSVGQARGRQELDERLEAVAADWVPLSWEVRTLAFIAREVETPFRVERTIPLGE